MAESIEDMSALMDSANEKNKKRKQKQPTDDEDCDMDKVISQYQASIKKIKFNPDTAVAELRQNVLKLDDNQRQTRKQYFDAIFKKLSEITNEVEADYNVMKENEKRLEQMTAAFMKCIRQSTTACKQKLEMLHKMQLLQKQVNEMESEHKQESELLMDKVDGFMKKAQEKMARESKRKSLDRVRQILSAMNNDE